MFVRNSGLSELRSTLKHASLTERIDAERNGVPMFVARKVHDALGITSSQFSAITGISESVYRRRAKNVDGKLSGTPAWSILGVMELIDVAEDLVDPQFEASTNFDAAIWLGEWLYRPQPALGGIRPAEFVDTVSGRKEVKRVLGAIVSGAFL